MGKMGPPPLDDTPELATTGAQPTDSVDARTLLGVHRTSRRHRLWVLGLSTALLLAILLAVSLGAVTTPVSTIVQIIGHHTIGAPGVATWSPALDAIVWDVRLPRVLLGAVVGAGLAITGAVLQAMVRNVLADPYLLGINSGASTGAAASILFGIGAGMGEYALQGSAFAGALAAAFLVYFIARGAARVTSVRLLLAGVAVGYALSALTSFLVFASGSAEGARSVLFWLLGSLGLAAWDIPLLVVTVVVLGSAVLLIVWSRRLDALAIGDETALTLGVSPAKLRSRLLVVVSLNVGAIVAASGSIGFVGLVVPHLARRAVGSDHRRVLPVAALMGATLLVLADLAARMILRPQEIPIGIITALVGAPFLLVLLRRMPGAR
ncbi:iron ABC transporter permease [Yimella sp. cx-51]|uniref:FecCD family ABC transporter permease n=1 Tax=Yimella sp. cx-51 TaxID=2770551 RepID=UPI001FCB7805|nr:iron ABC transporter permease [Yimella sp. cx-51]